MAFDEQERPDDEISYLALQTGTAIVAADGHVVGHVTHVLGDLEEDVFDGIGYRHGLLGQRMLPRRVIAQITRAAVHLSIPFSDVEQVSTTYAEERIYSAREHGKKARWGKDEDEERY